MCQIQPLAPCDTLVVSALQKSLTEFNGPDPLSVEFATTPTGRPDSTAAIEYVGARGRTE